MQNSWVPVWEFTLLEQPLIGNLKTPELQKDLSASRRTSLAACGMSFLLFGVVGSSSLLSVWIRNLGLATH